MNEFVRDLDFGPFSHFDGRRGRWSVVGRDDIVREGASGPYTDERSLKRGPSGVGNQFVSLVCRARDQDVQRVTPDRARAAAQKKSEEVRESSGSNV